MVCFELLHARGPPKRRFYSSWNSLYFPEIFWQRKLRIHAIRRGDSKHFTAKVCSNTCFRWEDSRKYLNEIIFTRDGAVPRCLHGLRFIQQKVNILENGSIRCRLQDLLDFTLKTAALKYNNNNNNRLLILQAWAVKLCKNQKKATYFKNSPWPKCTEKTNRGSAAPNRLNPFLSS